MHNINCDVETRFCLEICIVKLSGFALQSPGFHFSAKARFHTYPDVLINSVERREHQCPSPNTFLFSVNHRCRFTMTEKKLLGISPFAVAIDIVDGNGALVGTANVPLRTAPNGASSTAKTSGPLLRSISLFDAFGKYAGVLEADCVVYPEPRDFQQQGASRASSPAAGDISRNNAPSAPQPLAVSALNAAQTPASNQKRLTLEGQGRALALNTSNAVSPATGADASGPLVLRVVVDESKIRRTHQDPSPTSATPAYASGHPASEKSLFHVVQYDILFQLKSISETLLSTIVNEEGRLGNVKIDSKLRSDARVAKLLETVDAVGWLSNVCLQIAMNAAEKAKDSVSSPGKAGREGSAGTVPPSSPTAAEPDRHKPNYSLSTAPPKKGTMLHLLRFEVLYQVQCQSVNLSLLVNKYRTSLDQTMMESVHPQHKSFFRKLAKTVMQLNRYLNICIQTTFDNNFRSSSPSKKSSSSSKQRQSSSRRRKHGRGRGNSRSSSSSSSSSSSDRSRRRRRSRSSTSSSSSSESYSSDFSSNASTKGKAKAPAVATAAKPSTANVPPQLAIAAANAHLPPKSVKVADMSSIHMLSSPPPVASPPVAAAAAVSAIGQQQHQALPPAVNDSIGLISIIAPSAPQYAAATDSKVIPVIPSAAPLQQADASAAAVVNVSAQPSSQAPVNTTAVLNQPAVAAAAPLVKFEATPVTASLTTVPPPPQPPAAAVPPPSSTQLNSADQARNVSMYNADFKPFGSSFAGPPSAAQSITAIAAMHGIY